MVFASDLLVLVAIIGFSLAVLYLITYVPVLKDIIAIKAQAQLLLFNSDRGSALASFLTSTSNGLKYEEILGDALAKNRPQGIDSELVVLLRKLDAALSVRYGSNELWSYGIVGGRAAHADIAMPGLKKGELVVS